MPWQKQDGVLAFMVSVGGNENIRPRRQIIKSYMTAPMGSIIKAGFEHRAGAGPAGGGTGYVCGRDGTMSSINTAST
jgi:hypothetical protein